ncbi:hypothetical protein JAAARDRAFT_30102 [Jaapia argillacea MUCL 33604]|uniref:HIT domain-containing protein n=1 Tax=Jaapia argillacea MUCL 33604 TaxID=933084 RepID=A0A067QHW3_9AGAM|nr:hypothetical protein JAAARDRAFT_30102 [Jaapia argillacea MUCL 33604]
MSKRSDLSKARKMTSFIIDQHKGRTPHPSWEDHPECPFCRIIRGDGDAFRVYENDKVVAFLDILPLRQGHTLVVPKTHCPRLSELPADLAAALGEAITKVAHALTKAMNNTALNVVCNQEYAQAVPHVHYHIIPAPTFESTAKISPYPSLKHGRQAPLSRSEMHRMEFEAREELDQEEGGELVRKIRALL